jgi:PncC family amidohydrolase
MSDIRCPAAAVAESCTGGLLASLITAEPGASEYFAGGVIAYSRKAKTGILGVPDEVIDAYGMVSEEVALAMARGVCALTGAEIGAATTGLAGPGGDGSGTPVGTVCISVYDARDGKEETVTLVFGGGRGEVREAAANTALDMIRRKMLT